MCPKGPIKNRSDESYIDRKYKLLSWVEIKHGRRLVVLQSMAAERLGFGYEMTEQILEEAVLDGLITKEVKRARGRKEATHETKRVVRYKAGQ